VPVPVPVPAASMPPNVAKERLTLEELRERESDFDTERSDVLSLETNAPVEANPLVGMEDTPLDSCTPDRDQDSLSSADDEHAKMAVQELSRDDIEIGCLLGTGTFSSVHRVTLLHVRTGSSEEEQTHGHAHNPRHSNANKKQYALKRLREMMDEKTTIIAAKDLIFEANILAKLPAHENIVQLYAVSTNFWESPAQGFLVLDKINETLQFRLIRLRAPSSKTNLVRSWIPRFNFNRNRSELKSQQQSRIDTIALGVARAMEFLHSHRIIYRDLKPQNVGFDDQGMVRIFDFGLSRIRPKEKKRMTGGTGTARYMAPEVARCEDYCFSSDVHAYAILLWEICTLEKPYGSIGSMQALFKKAVHGNSRPPLGAICSPSVKKLLKISWHPDPSTRPSFAFIVKQLELESTVVSEPIRRIASIEDR
jgi:serine/threonine protein kinase